MLIIMLSLAVMSWFLFNLAITDFFHLYSIISINFIDNLVSDFINSIYIHLLPSYFS